MTTFESNQSIRASGCSRTRRLFESRQFEHRLRHDRVVVLATSRGHRGVAAVAERRPSRAQRCRARPASTTTLRMSFANRCVLNPGLYVPLSARSPCTSSTRLCANPPSSASRTFAGVDAGLARQRERFGDDDERAADHHLVTELAQLTGARLADVDDLLRIAHRRRGWASLRRMPADRRRP